VFWAQCYSFDEYGPHAIVDKELISFSSFRTHHVNPLRSAFLALDLSYFKKVGTIFFFFFLPVH
jgi:hypothetical protein